MPSSASAPEAGDEPPAAVVADEDAREELERAQEVGLGAEVGEERARPSGQRSGGLGAAAPPRACRSRRWASSKSSRSVRPPSGLRSRAASERSSPRGGGEAQRGEQVVDGELAADAQEVGAGDRHARPASARG